MQMPTLRPIALLIGLLLAGCATGGARSPDPTTPTPAAAPDKRIKTFREAGKTAYMTAEPVTLHKPEAGARWLLAASVYQNDLTAASRPDPAKPALLIFNFQGRPDLFSPVRDSLKFVVAVDDGIDGGAVYCPVAWVGGPDDSFGGTTLSFSAVLSPADVRRILNAGKAVGAVVDTSKPEAGKAWSKLAIFDLRETGVTAALRAFFAR